MIPGERTWMSWWLKTEPNVSKGVAYLDDGTMVVVEDGRYYLNEHLNHCDLCHSNGCWTDDFCKPAHSTHEIKEETDKGDKSNKNSTTNQKNNKEEVELTFLFGSSIVHLKRCRLFGTLEYCMKCVR